MNLEARSLNNKKMNDDKNKKQEKVEEVNQVLGEDKESAFAKASHAAEALRDKSADKGKKEESKVELLQKKIEELEEQLKRTVADYRNLQKRTDEQRREFIQYAKSELLLELFGAFDALFLAEKYVTDEGLKLSIRLLRETFERIGVKRIETEGKMYDARLMECIATEEGEEGKVLAETRPGFMLDDKILRPAQVKVGKNKN